MRISLVGVALITSVLAACSTTPLAPAPAPAAKPVAQASTPAPAPAAAPVQSEAEALAAKMRQQMADLNSKSVFFDFDAYTVKASYNDLLQQQANFLKANRTVSLALQGNSDERGGTEYNLALGQKRADAVRSALMLLGAQGDRIESTSYGKEKPRATCHDESCWSQNRRVDLGNSPKR